MTVGAGEDADGTGDVWSVTALAVCAFPLPGLEIVTVSSPFWRADSSNAVAPCPSGKTVIGTGASLTNGWGQVAIRRLELAVATDGVNAMGMVDQDGYSGSWLITAYAVPTATGPVLSAMICLIFNVNVKVALAPASRPGEE